MKKALLTLAALLAVSSLFAKKPIIGVSGYATDGKNSAGVTYTSAVRNAGGVPVVIPPTGCDEQIEAYVNILDGLIMTGGADFHPSLYGEEAIRQLGTVQNYRDEFDIKLVRAAVAKGIPVFGICRGEQLLAVAFGGKLWQDIPSQVKESYIRHQQSGTNSDVGIHSIKMEKGCFLEKAMGDGELFVNSFHHQAIKVPAPGFKVVATAPDGIVEAVERVGALDSKYKDGGAMIIGTQFHPEGFAIKPDSPFVKIFKLFTDEAAKKTK